ncbi:MAG TPA: 4-(cytidine 5'-diphospho)-2-C-methyl-D-erythritol kinase [Acidimicrobiales bacterium]
MGVTVTAPAKLTLSLRVTGVRADSLHLLDAEMVSIDLADTLTFEPGSGITVDDEVCGGLGVGDVPLGPENLVLRALDVTRRRAAVRLVKRIPVGAGLGGGSADAAAVLRWAGSTDLALAVGLGADVPFCVRGGRSRVTGVGEQVEPLAFEARRFVLLLPPLSVDTGAVYRQWDERRARFSAAGDGDAGDGDASANDLEAAAIDVVPALARWRDAFASLTGRRPRLAGSGSSWFVEGDCRALGIAGDDFVAIDDERAPLIEARTVPAHPVV